MDKKEYEFSAWNDVYDTKPETLMTPGEFADTIRNFIYKEENEKYRRMKTEEELGLSKKGSADKYKKTLAGVTVAALYKKGPRIKEGHYEYTGLCCLDYDHLTDLEEKIKAIGRDRHVRLLCKSISHKGIKVIVATDNKDGKQHEEAYKQTARYFEKYGLHSDVLDELPRNVNSLCFIPDDENAIYNEHSEIFHIESSTVEASSMSPLQSAFQPADPAVLLPQSSSIEARYAASKKFADAIPFAASKRHAHLVRLACQANRYGIPFEILEARCVHDLQQDGFLEKEIRDTIEDIYERYAEEGSTHLLRQENNEVKTHYTAEWLYDIEMEQMEAPQNMWTMDNFIRRRTVTLWQSRPGLGKSTMMRQLCLILCHEELEQEFLGIPLHGQHHAAIYSSYEDSCIDTKESFDKQANALGINHNRRLRFHFPQSNNIDKLLEDYKIQMKEQLVDLIVIDPYNSLYSSMNKDSKDSLAQRSFMDKLIEFAETYDIAIVVIMHPLKGGYSNDEIDIRYTPGTGSIERCRSISAVTELRSQNPQNLYLIQVKSNYSKSIHRRQYIEISKNEDTFIYSATGKIIPIAGSFGMTREVKKQDHEEKKKKIITEIFTEHEQLTHSAFCSKYSQKTGKSEVTAGRDLKEMMKLDVIVHDENTKMYKMKKDETAKLAETAIKSNELMQWVEENYENCPF